MKTMPDEVLQFVAREPSATLATAIDDSGGIHAAPLVFWMDPKDCAVYFVTGRDTVKCTSLRKTTEVRAACVIGTTKAVPYCLQMRGYATIANQKAYREQVQAYYHKRGNRNDDIDDPANVLLRFHPDWIRVTDYTSGSPRMDLVEPS